MRLLAGQIPPRRFGPGRAMPALVSVHDVMPESMADVDSILAVLARHRIGKATLLVVPGRQWPAEHIARLRAWHAAGHEIAGHGWCHRSGPPAGIRHRLHSRLISRNVAEHLALSRRQTLDLLRRCSRWFSHNGLPVPLLYVPPAWALGRLRRRDLSLLPFRCYETLGGLYDAAAGRFHPMPLVGFEADTRLRQLFLGGFNAVNVRLASGFGLPLRVAIHPQDFRLRLAGRLHRLLSGPLQAVGYGCIGCRFPGPGSLA